MLAIKLPKDMDERLSTLARRTKRSKASCARLAIAEFLTEAEDRRIAQYRLRRPGKRVPLADLKARLGLED